MLDSVPYGAMGEFFPASNKTEKGMLFAYGTKDCLS